MSIQVASRARGIKPSMIRVLRDYATPTTLDLGLGQTDLPVSESAVTALSEHLGESPVRASYCPNLGTSEARAAVAARYDIRPEEVMITHGVQQALAVAILGLIEPGDEVIVPEPAFPAYPNLIEMAQGVPVSVALSAHTDWALDVEAIAAAITPKTRAILLNSPNNPTGAVYSRENLAEVLALCAKHDILWISDEIYEDYVYDGQAHCSPADFPEYRDLGVRLSGVSKSHHMMGWRLGWMTGPAEVIEALKPLTQHLITSASTLSQRAAVASLATHEQSMAGTLEIFRRRRDLAVAAINAMPGVEVTGGAGAFYLFLDVSGVLKHIGTSLDLALHILKDVDVITIPGVGFGDAGQAYLRLAYTVDEAVLTEALARLHDCFERIVFGAPSPQ